VTCNKIRKLPPDTRTQSRRWVLILTFVVELLGQQRFDVWEPRNNPPSTQSLPVEPEGQNPSMKQSSAILESRCPPPDRKNCRMTFCGGRSARRATA